MLLIAALLLTPCAPGTTSAQELLYPIGVQLGAGAVVPVGDAAEAAGLGWNVAVAGDIELLPGLALRLDYFYGRFAAEQVEVTAATISRLPLPTATLSGKLQMHAGSFDLLWRIRQRGGARTFYLLGGPVLAYRRATLTSRRSDLGEAFNQVGVTFCEPQWFECADTLQRYHQVLGIRRSTDLGLNAGAGLIVDVGLNASLFAEARYVYLDGPSFRDPAGARHSANASFLPVTAGLRFEW